MPAQTLKPSGFFVCGRMGRFRKMMKRIILFFVLVVEISKAQFHIGETDDVVWPYITPGIQIGLNSGKGLFYSFQFTVGLIPVKYPIIPGMTIGKRYYFGNKRKNIAKETYTYKGYTDKSCWRHWWWLWQNHQFSRST